MGLSNVGIAVISVVAFFAVFVGLAHKYHGQRRNGRNGGGVILSGNSRDCFTCVRNDRVRPRDCFTAFAMTGVYRGRRWLPEFTAWHVRAGNEKAAPGG